MKLVSSKSPLYINFVGGRLVRRNAEMFFPEGRRFDSHKGFNSTMDVCFHV